MRALVISALALLIASLCGCNLLLGIEPLKANNPKDAGAKDGAISQGDGAVKNKDAGTDGGKPSTGKSDAGGKGGSDASTDASSTPGDGGGDAGKDSGPNDAGGDSGSDAAGSSITVAGKVVDYFLHGVSGVTVSVGSNSTSSASDGSFTLSDVTPPYDVTLIVNTQVSSGSARFAWVFQGLTRTDPTLQIYRGRPYWSGEIKITVNNLSFPIGSSQTLDSDYAGPDGEFELSLDSMMTDYSGAEWRGASTTQVAAHALLWNHASSGPAVPTMFLAHDTHPVGLDSNAAGMVTFDLSTSSPLMNGMVSGTVTNPLTSDRSNEVYVRWDDDAAIQVASDGLPASNGAFSYVVPALPKAGAIVAAINGYLSTPPYAVAYQDALAAGTTGVSLTIPPVMSLVKPAANATGVDGSTVFQWAGASQVALLTVDAYDTYDTVFIVTAAKQAQIPDPPVSAFAANAKLIWWIEAHGSYATVDDACGSEGMLDTYAYGQPRGPRRGPGTYTESEHRSVMTKP